MSDINPGDPALFEPDAFAVGLAAAIVARRERRRAAGRPNADGPRDAAAVELSRRAGTDTRGDLYHLCDGCREWVDSIWWVGPQYPRARLCAKCADAIGQGPRAAGGSGGNR